MKVAVIGGGSTYTPELINGFVERADNLSLDELWLMDIDQKRLDVVGGFAQRMVKAKDARFSVHLTTDRQMAVRDANYVITQLRVGGMQARREDEYLGRRHHLIGQETTGIGGMAKALRTIPVVLDIAEDMRNYAPGALLVNFTNPSGLVTEALSRYAIDVPSVGVCNVAINTKMDMLKALKPENWTEFSPDEAILNTLGLNHLSWHRGLVVRGENMWPQVMAGYLEQLRAAEDPEWDANLIETLQMLPNYYLQYYYYTEHKLHQQNTWPPSRAEQVMTIEEKLLAQYAEPERTEPPEELMQRGGAYYSTVATQLLHAHFNDLGEVHVVNVPHGGAVPGWPADWVLEMPCRIGHKGITPLPTEPLPLACYGLLAHVKAFELLTVEAAVHGNRAAAFQALMAHPLGPPADKIQVVLDDMLAVNAPYLPQFTT
ncbi:MAG: 6-phospho-beta-glucosidase [Anaerolineales bacterium]|nr:MAG: 6-phospho-beta-glucosidase [Anaerolineales bacterium]